jgi:RimJ/RimL family protein N-acetyltransferase
LQVTATERLRLRRLTLRDGAFILELVNEPAWIRNIGDKHVSTLEDAERYIRDVVLRMYERLGYGLYLVESRESGDPMGICGFVRRDSLEGPDLGFAFLQRFWGVGYAGEAAAAVMSYAWNALAFTRVLAIASRQNERSTRLLGRLGFSLLRAMRVEAGDEVDVYAKEKHSRDVESNVGRASAS